MSSLEERLELPLSQTPNFTSWIQVCTWLNMFKSAGMQSVWNGLCCESYVWLKNDLCAGVKGRHQIIRMAILIRVATLIILLCGPDSATSTWSQPETRGKQPPPRHGHIIIAVGPKIYIHGGMSGDKFHNDMYSLDTSRSQLHYPPGCCFPQMAPNGIFHVYLKGTWCGKKYGPKETSHWQ